MQPATLETEIIQDQTNATAILDERTLNIRSATTTSLPTRIRLLHDPGLETEVLLEPWSIFRGKNCVVTSMPHTHNSSTAACLVQWPGTVTW